MTEQERLQPIFMPFEGRGCIDCRHHFLAPHYVRGEPWIDLTTGMKMTGGIDKVEAVFCSKRGGRADKRCEDFAE